MNAGFEIAWRGHIDPGDDIPEQLPALRDISLVSQTPLQHASFSDLQIRSVAFISSSAIPLRLIGTQKFRLFSGCDETKQWLVEQFIHDDEPEHNEHDGSANPNDSTPCFWWLEDGSHSPRALLLHTYRGAHAQPFQEEELLIFAATTTEQQGNHARETLSRPSISLVSESVTPRPSTIEFLVLDLLNETGFDSTNQNLATNSTAPFSNQDDPASLDSSAGEPLSLEHEVVPIGLNTPHAHPPVAFHDRREVTRSATTGLTEITQPEFRQNKRLQSLDLSRRSSLSRVMSANADISPRPGSPSVSAIEEQNRAAIQRLIMIGMRMYGFSHRHRRQDSMSTSQSTATVKPMTPTTFDVNTKLRDFDDEYKQIYHQTYRGVCLALRNHISVRALPAETLQRIVDSLLAVFCTNPFEDSSAMMFDSGADAMGEPRT